MKKKSKRNIDICLTPSMLDFFDLSQKKVVVIDVFRATSAICVFLNNGGNRVFTVSTVKDAVKMKTTMDTEDFLFAAERNGSIVSGFDLGNSPLLYDRKKFDGISLAITTTNGTNAIEKSKNAGNGILLASFLNVSAVAEHIISKDKCDILIVCSGWRGRFCIEDSLLAGLLSKKLLKNDMFYSNSDSVFMSQNLYESAQNNLSDFLLNSSYRQRMNLEEDINYCLQVDIMNCVPIWSQLQLMKKNNLFSGFFISNKN